MAQTPLRLATGLRIFRFGDRALSLDTNLSDEGLYLIVGLSWKVHYFVYLIGYRVKAFSSPFIGLLLFPLAVHLLARPFGWIDQLAVLWALSRGSEYLHLPAVMYT